MSDVLEKMIRDTVRECEEEHRLLVSAHNALAGSYWLRESWSAAAEEYRAVLRACQDVERDSKDAVRMDPLQQIHALINLAKLLAIKKEEIPPTLRDEHLLGDAENLTQKYYREGLELIEKTKLELGDCDVRTEITEVRPIEAWHSNVGKICERDGLSLDFVSTVQERLLDNAGPEAARFKAFNSPAGLSFSLINEFEQLKRARELLASDLDQLAAFPLDSEELNRKASQCHLRPEAEQINLCKICSVAERFDEYEGRLYNFTETKGKDNVVDGEKVDVLGSLRQGTWADSPLQKALKAVHFFASRRLPKKQVEEWVEAGGKHLALFETFKKEFRLMRALWMAIRDHSAKRDEVLMAAERLRFKTLEEIDVERAFHQRAGTSKKDAVAPAIPLNAIFRGEVETRILQYKSDVSGAEGSLARKLSHLNYLKSLRNLESEDGNKEECPICRRALGFSWGVLLCGHCFCMECLQLLSTKYSVGRGNIRCAICRISCDPTNINYVSTVKKTDTSDTDEAVPVRGSYSTKVEAVVRRMLEIKLKEPMAKVLVFSAWSDLLSVLESALRENALDFLTLKGRSHENCIQQFRTDPKYQALLLPIQSGANGLNLIEATHVLIVEPQMNPAAEQQAIGRVDRIGQRHATTVHRFLVRGTIEEKLHAMLDRTIHDSMLQRGNEASGNLTLSQLAELLHGAPVPQLSHEEDY